MRSAREGCESINRAGTREENELDGLCHRCFALQQIDRSRLISSEIRCRGGHSLLPAAAIVRPQQPDERAAQCMHFPAHRLPCCVVCICCRCSKAKVALLRLSFSLVASLPRAAELPCSSPSDATAAQLNSACALATPSHARTGQAAGMRVG